MLDYEGAHEIERAWREGLTPDPWLSVSDWSDQHRMLSSKAAAEPGRWRTARTPYLREIMDCLSPASPIERVVLMKGAQVGGPLALDTPLPTPSGWTTMGAVAVGDWVFDERGSPCRVVGVSPVLESRDCFEIVFDDGERVVCDGEHRWPVWDFTNDVPVRKTLTTLQMLRRTQIGSSPRRRYGVDNTAALTLPPRELPIHPYLLGLWLGDGNTWMNHISMHEDDGEVVEHLAGCGVRALWRLPKWRKGKCANLVIDPVFAVDDEGQAPASCGTSWFSVRLRQLNLIDNKHIPAAYMRASREQRLDLVRGLMDSDGCITPDGKRCEFSNIEPSLKDGMVELLRSLGYKPTIYVAPPGDMIGPQGRRIHRRGYWRVSWTAYAEEPMFRFRRKVARMRSVVRGRPWKALRRRIVEIRPVASVPVRCIEVDAPSHLYLCGRGFIPTHNTEAGSNWIGYVIHHAPGPMMAVWPTVEMAKRNSKQRIDPLIEESPVLAGLIAPARSRDAGNTILAKEFRGGVLVMTGANSAVGLRSMPVRYLFLDEVDGYPLDVEGEGDAISLAEARTRTFTRRKIFIVSTPTIAGASSIEREYEASDQRRYFVPCPHCAHAQWLRFEQLRWERGRPETVAYVCESCDKPIAEHHKTWMLEQGQWRATAPGNGRTAGFHLSSLYSPVGWRSWREIAAAWEAAIDKTTGSASAIKTFKNTELGETWVEEGEAPDWQHLLERREDYRIGSVPQGGLLLVAGADVQKDRIEISVWAFGRGKEAWLVEHRVLMGDTARDPVWLQLRAMLAETWTHACGAQLPLARFAIDTGFATQEVYAFVRACRDSRVMAIKGAARGAALIGTPTAVDVTVAGKKLRRGLKLYTVVVGIAKQALYQHLRLHADVASDGLTPVYPAGFIHLPKIDAEFLQQLCAEQLITRRDRNGYAVREWQKLRERNEALDCFDEQTEVLTRNGWKRFADVSYGDILATVNLESDCIEYQTPQHLIARSHDGPMLTVNGTRLNFMVTPNHRMVTYRKEFDRQTMRWRFDTPPQITLARDLTIHHTIKINAQWRGISHTNVTIPASCKRSCRTPIEPERQVDAMALARLLGWYVAEGTCSIAANQRSIRRVVTIAQSKPEGRALIEAVLDQLPWTWHWTDRCAVVTSKQMYEYLQRECWGLHDQKRVPQWIKDADRDVIAAFVEAAVAGDGWIQNRHRSYATTSRLLADDMAELFFKLGGTPSVTECHPSGWSIRDRSGTDLLPQYHVRENNKRRSASLDGQGRKFMVEAIPYQGRVYCATVPNGTLVVRRAGKMMIAGNCAVYARAAAAAAGLDRFEHRHWRELERSLGIQEAPDPPPMAITTPPDEATGDGGLSTSARPSRRRVVKSRWLYR